MGGHAGQTDEDNRTGVQGSRPNTSRKGTRTVQNSPSAGGGGQPAWARKKNEKYYKLRDGRHRRQGQDRELYPILPLIGEVLHCNTPPTPKRSNQKKRNTQTEGTKKKCSPQKKIGWCPVHHFFVVVDASADSWHPQLSTEGSTSPKLLSYHVHPFTWRERKKNGYCRVLWYCIHSTRPG